MLVEPRHASTSHGINAPLCSETSRLTFEAVNYRATAARRHQLSLTIQRYPCWRMVAGVCLSTRPSVYATIHEPIRHIRREQKVIESHAFVLRPAIKFVIPECPERPIWM